MIAEFSMAELSESHRLAPAAFAAAAGGGLTALEWLIAIWLLLIGGCIGSLMNVIVYRWPAGMSIVFPNSRCPRCLHPIRLIDNMPVLSWLVLRGRCRDCRARISPRYPLVEATIAGLFFSLALIEVFADAATLPNPWRIARAPAVIWATFGIHALLICTLICAALIHYDGQRVPRKLYIPAAVAGFVVPLVWPEIRPLSGFDAWRSGWLECVGDSLAGLFFGGMFGWLCAMATAGPRGRVRPRVVAPLMVTGLVLGWQAVAVVAPAAAAFHLLASIESRLRSNLAPVPWTAYAVIAVVLHLVYWRWLVDRLPWLGAQAGIPTLMGAAAVSFALSLASFGIRRNRADRPTSPDAD